MSSKLNNKGLTLSKKIGFFLKFRGYNVLSDKEDKEIRDIIVTRKGENNKILIRVIPTTTLVSGKIGVHYVRKMTEKLEKDDLKGGILIGEGFSYSARKEAKIPGIETIEKSKIPAFNIFKHNLVPKHEILPKKEAREILERYHVESHQLPRIRSLDPAVFLIGAKSGDVIKITRESPTAGTYVTYRHVI